MAKNILTQSPPNEKPIVFNSAMIRAIEADHKTQTRRLVRWIAERRKAGANLNPINPVLNDAGELWFTEGGLPLGPFKCPYGQPGDRLWVRQTWQAKEANGKWWHEIKREERELYNWSVFDRATSDIVPPKWIPSIFMPRWACRIILEVTGVRVERIQDISAADALAEGIREYNYNNGSKGYWLQELALGAMPTPPQYGIARLWDSIYAKRGFGWASNPWVWVVEFRRMSDG
jgi:hypothetical protein